MSWYTVMSAMEDVKTQKMGLATILYNVGFQGPSRRDVEFALSSKWLRDTLPYSMSLY